MTVKPGETPPRGETDWARVNAMTEEEVLAAARADPDAQPLDSETLARMRRVSPVSVVNSRLRRWLMAPVKQKTTQAEAMEEQYVVDRDGRRQAVILPLEEYKRLREDLHDLAVVAERREEEPVSLEEMKRRLLFGTGAKPTSCYDHLAGEKRIASSPALRQPPPP